MAKKTKLDNYSKLLIAAAVIIALMLTFICVDKVIDNNNKKAYEARIIELQQAIARLNIDFYMGSDDEEAGDDATDDIYTGSLLDECIDELNSIYHADEDIAVTMAKILFVRGIDKIWAKDINDVTKYPMAEPRVTTEIDGSIYVKRDVKYSDVVDEYSKVLTDDLLEDTLKASFAEVDGYLYVIAGGNSVDDRVSNVQVLASSALDDIYIFRIKYNTVSSSGEITSEDNTCTLTIKQVDNSFLIADLEFDKIEEEPVSEPEATTEETSSQPETANEEETASED